MRNPVMQWQIVAKEPEAVTRYALAIVRDPAGLSFGLYRPRPGAGS